VSVDDSLLSSGLSALALVAANVPTISRLAIIIGIFDRVAAEAYSTTGVMQVLPRHDPATLRSRCPTRCPHDVLPIAGIERRELLDQRLQGRRHVVIVWGLGLSHLLEV
jgi:hypothetical protein